MVRIGLRRIIKVKRNIRKFMGVDTFLTFLGQIRNTELLCVIETKKIQRLEKPISTKKLRIYPKSSFRKVPYQSFKR